MVIVGSSGAEPGAGNTSYTMSVKGSLRETDSKAEEIYYLGCSGRSSSTRSAVRYFQSCLGLILRIGLIKFYQDHHPHTPSRPFMPETADIDRLGFSACPTRLQNDGREPFRLPIKAPRAKRIGWFLDAPSIISTEAPNSCSSLSVQLFKEATWQTHSEMDAGEWNQHPHN